MTNISEIENIVEIHMVCLSYNSNNIVSDEVNYVVEILNEKNYYNYFTFHNIIILYILPVLKQKERIKSIMYQDKTQKILLSVY